MDKFFLCTCFGLLVLISTGCWSDFRHSSINNHKQIVHVDHQLRNIRKRGLGNVVGSATFEGLTAYRKLIHGATYKETKMGAKIYEKNHGYREALKDFNALHLIDVRKHPLGEGYVARVGDKLIQVKEKTEMFQTSYISIMDIKGRQPETIILYPDHIH